MMGLTNLEEKIANEDVEKTFNSIVVYLQRLPPDGKTIHRKINLTIACLTCVEEYEEGLHPQETFKQLKERDSDSYFLWLDAIKRANEKFGYLI